MKIYRKKNIIQIDGKNKKFNSVSAAKRESKRLQKIHGLGSVRIV